MYTQDPTRRPAAATDRKESGQPTMAGRSVLARVIRAVLGVRLFYKILAANALLLVAVLLLDSALTAHLVRTAPGASATDLSLALGLVAVAVSVIVNGAIVHLALTPLRGLQEAASHVSAGDLAARAEATALADRDLARLIETFNAMLDGIFRYRERLRRIAGRALHAAESERKRISRDLHDDTAQRIASTMVKLRALRSAKSEAEQEAVLNELRSDLAETVEHVREVAHGLRPPSLDLLGITSALKSYARKVSEGAGLELVTDMESFDAHLGEEGDLALYRIAQAALANVVRHAQAQTVTLRTACGERAVRLSVEDDGRGFDPETVLGSGESLGLLGMEERAAYVGGRVSIHSEPGAGTRIELEIPFAETASHV